MHFRATTKFFPLAAIFLAGALASYAQTFRGGITGSVSDSTGSVLSGATVNINNTATGLKRTTETSGAGDFSFPDLPLGDYQLTATMAGFQTLKMDRVTVEVGKTTALNITLPVASQSSSVEVSANAAVLDTATATLNAVVPTKAVQELPLNGRDFTQLVKLAPGVNGAGSVNGTRTNQNNWQIDGADNNDLWHNAAAVNQGGVSGVAGTLLPIEAIDQFSVQSNANAEAGRNGGGSVNMVIKSGTNALHGSLYYFNRNDALAANTPFAPAHSAKPKLKNNQFGGSVGGPIIHNKTFYFLTYERQKFIVGNENGGTEPSAAWVSQATAVLNKYGVAVNPVSTNLLSLWPARGRTGGATAPNFFSTDDSDNYSDNGIIKIDHIFNDHNNLAFRYFVGTGAQTAPVGSPYHEYYQVAPSRMHNFSLVYNTVITDRVVNQVLAGVNYFKQTFNDFDTSANPVALGLNTGVTNPTLFGSPSISVNGFDDVGLTPPLGRIDTTGHLNEILTYTTGRHQFRMGGEYRRSRLDVFYQRNKRGTFSFDGSQGPWANDPAVDSTTKALADFLAGDVASSSITRGNLQRNYYVNTLDFFGQDTWQLSPRLSLNLGLRWEYFGPIHEPTNRISTFIPSKGGIVFTGHGIDTLYPKKFTNFAPRFGFAYTPTPGGRLVLRGNYGIYFDQPNVNGFADNRPPNGGATGILSNPAGPDPVFALSRSNYTIVPGQTIFGDNNVPNPPYGVFSVSQDFKNAYVQNFGLNGQYQVGAAGVLQVGYVGSLGRKLLIVRDINQAPTSPLGSAAKRSVQNTLRPYYAAFPLYSAINQVESIGNSHYNSLQTSFRTTAWHNLTSQFSYTLGHAMDDLSAVRGRNPTNSYNLAYDYGNADFDVRHTFSGYFNYNVPRFNAGPDKLVNGWQFNSLMSFYSGQPFTVFSGRNVSGTFEGRDRVDLVGDPFAGVSHALTNGYIQWLNPAAFAQPAPGTFGSIKRNRFYGPGFGDVDFSIFKNTPITERVTTQFRVEMFNLFNRTNLPNPTTKLSSGSFGRIFDTVGDANGATGIGAGEPFNVQLALKVIF